MLKVKNLKCGYKDNIILENVSFTTDPGEILCILGPNGSGKSTLIKSIIGLLDIYQGEILLDNKNIEKYSWKDRAKIISYIPQVFSSTFQYRSIDIVLMGRTSYMDIISSPSKKDEEIAEEAMELLKISHLKNKIYSQLSGGERQLVKIAQALAQKSKLIIMDEPTNNLDFGNQVIMLNHIKKCSDMGITIIMATHFPEQAFLYGTKALLVKDGEVEEIDKPKENLTEENLESLYGVKVKITELISEGKKTKICLPVF